MAYSTASLTQMDSHLEPTRVGLKAESLAQRRYWGSHLVVSREHRWADSRASPIQMGSLRVDWRAGRKAESLARRIRKASQMA